MGDTPISRDPGKSVGPSPPTSPEPALSPEERRLAADFLVAEYTTLTTALNAARSASLTRTSLYLGVLSAAGVALGFVSQGGVDTTTFRVVTLAVLALVLFLGVATFVRLVQVQRESMVYDIGLNRIRHFFQESAPGSRRYYVLPPYDDGPALFRSIESGMSGRSPRFQLLHMLARTQGIVGVVTAVVAAAFGGIMVARAGTVVGWGAAALAFLLTLVALFAYWQRSLARLVDAIVPINPTPPDQLTLVI